MTERLYYADAYLTSFDARVLERAGDGHRLYLDRTALYPTSGGQPNDLGTIAGVEVLDVIDEDGRIVHVLAGAVDSDVVHGEVDWARRFDHMQQHTGQHLLSAVLADGFGCQTVSVHFGSDSSTLDVDRETVDDACLREAERRANGIVAENRPVTVTFEDAASATGLRKAPGREGTIRVVTIEGADRSACGGTHVRVTGEIGAVMLRRRERVRKSTRLEFVCGLRAVRRVRRDFETLSRIAQHLSASLDDTPALVESLSAQTKELHARVRRLEGALDTYRARERYEAIAPDSVGRRYAVESSETGSPDEWRAIAIAFCTLPRAVFIAASHNPPAVLFATAPDAGIDAGKTLKTAVDAAGGRGGGSSRVAQGSVPSPAALDDVVRALQQNA